MTQSTSQPPHSIEIEQALLGALMIHPDKINEVIGTLEGDHFFEPLHSRIFASIQTEIDDGHRPTPLTLAPFFEGEMVGDLTIKQYLGRLVASATTLLNSKDYARIIREMADRRELIVIGERLQDRAYKTAEPAHSATSEAIEALTTILAPHRGRNTVSDIGAASEKLVARLKSKERPDIVPTGLIDLDAALGGGLYPGELILGAGRPSMGKSTIAPQIGLNIAKAGGGVGFFSLEMSTEVVTARCLSSWVWKNGSPILYADILAGSVPDSELYRLEEASAEIEAVPLVIDDQAALSCTEITARSRLLAAKFKRQGKRLRLIIVDLLGKVTASKAYHGNKVYELGEISAALCALAKDLEVPVFALHQVSRNTEGRDNKRPELADLRDSGNLEQDADVVIFLYRRAYYLERAKYDNREEEDARVAALRDCRNELALMIAKQRNGPVKTVEVFASMENNAIRNKVRP